MQEIWYENREYGIKMVNMLYGWQIYVMIKRREPKVKPSPRLILFRHGLHGFHGFKRFRS